MKKNISMFCAALAILSLTACGNNSDGHLETDPKEPSMSEALASNIQIMDKVQKSIFTDFIYDVGPRFGPIKKEEVVKARSIDAFFDKEQVEEMVDLKSVTVILIIDDEQSDMRAAGYGKDLTDAQLKLLGSSNYSTNFLIRADFRKMNSETGALEDSYASPHLTIVPEKQATYVSGKAALKEYLKVNSEDVRVNVDPDKLKPAKLFFTVTKNGTIENIHLDRPSGYPSVDKKMIELITKAPGLWEPAENAKGEKVNQELVISFGLMGC